MDSLNPQNPATSLEKPAGAPSGAPSSAEPVVHVIPEKFYGAALKQKVVPKKEPPKPVLPPGAQPPLPPGAQPPKPKPKSKLTPIILIVGLLVLLGGAAGAYFLYFGKKPAAPIAANVNVNEAPAAVCGDGKCAATENSKSCSEDCGEPSPVCGDEKCEPPEDAASCSEDCGAPQPVCGDNKCETGEDFGNCSADCQPPEPRPGKDSDSDGVSDNEEIQVFGTDPNKTDSDGDSFVDLNEILNLFDPARPRPAALIDNPNTRVYKNTDQAFEVFYPLKWTIKEEATEKSSIFFTAPTGEFIQVLIEDNSDGKSLLEWYLQQAPSVRSSEVQMFKTARGYDEILSPDRMTAFVVYSKRVFVISYNLGSILDVQFKATFGMMINSLIVTGEPIVKPQPPAVPPAEPPAVPPEQPPEPPPPPPPPSP